MMSPHCASRGRTRHEFFGAALAATGAFSALSAGGIASAAAPDHSAQQPTAAEAMERLMAGNRRYVADATTDRTRSSSRRLELTAGQRPFAIVLGCSDSRVPPEVVFDQSLGDLFTVRLAGNVADIFALGTMEYAVQHFGSPLLLVLGHEKCGAVAATVEAIRTGATPEGHVAALVNAIRPAAERAVAAGGSDPLDQAVRANVEAVVAKIAGSGPILRTAVAAHKLRVVGARYGLSDGRVTLLTA